MTKEQVQFSAYDHNHVPFYKLQHQVENSVCGLRITDYDGTAQNPKAWTEIFVQETYMVTGGTREVTRSIMITLNPEQRAALLATLLREEPESLPLTSEHLTK